MKRLDSYTHICLKDNFKKLLKILSEGNRDESLIVDIAGAKKDAETLKKNFERSSTDEKQLIEIFSMKSFGHINIIRCEFKKITGKSLEHSIKKCVTDSLKKAVLAIVRNANNPSEFFARCIKKAIDNHILDERSLGRMIIVRSEIDLMDIKEEFNRIFRKPLMSCFKGDISGSYREALLTLLGGN